jgi:DNA-binding CsgD family transcriptional regulator
MTFRDTVTRIIGALGEPQFHAVAADAVRAAMGFDLAAVVVHDERPEATVLFDNFDAAGRQGLATYARLTHRINPILANAPRCGVLRARDFRTRLHQPSSALGEYLRPAVDEELGFRTVGWPERMEEVGIWFEGCEGVVELGLYRQRGRCGLRDEELQPLHELAAPLAAAFERHHRWTRQRPGRSRELTAREREVCDLLLEGCSTEAIALRLGLSQYTVKDYRKQIFRKHRVCSLQALFAAHR